MALRDIAPGGADAAAAGVYSIDLNNIASSSGQAIGMDASAQLTLEGSASVTGSGLLFESGDTLLDGATLSSANAQQSFAVEAGAVVAMTGQVAASAPIAVASGGTLELLLGTLATSDVSVTDDGVAGHGLIAEPVAGATVTIGTSITGALQLGAFDAGAGGSVVLTSAATVSGNVDLNGPGIFSLSSANVHGHVVFDDAGGAVLQIQGTSFTPTIVWSTKTVARSISRPRRRMRRPSRR